MSTILAIETSAELASVALLRNGQLLVEQGPAGQNHSEVVLPMVQTILARAGIGLKQCDALAFGSGPGSFTGVRTACGAVQGLAFGSGLPVVPVTTLEAMAQACRKQGGGDDVLTILDARMGEVYWARYRFEERWQVVVAPGLSPAADVGCGGLPRACGNGLSAYAEAFRDKQFAAGGMARILPHAGEIAELAQDAFGRGLAVAAQDAQPFYLRNKVALTTQERLAKSAGVAA